MKLSIITINLNNKDGLRQTIESVLNQSFTDFEYLIIDGGSTDGSVEVIKEYEEQISYWVSEPDSGIYNAMNKGIFRASGSYLQFLNSGDILKDGSILENIFRNDYADAILYTEGFTFSADNIIQRIVLPEKISPLFLADHSICHAGAFIPSGFFRTIGNYNEGYKIVSDTEFFIKAFLNNIRFNKIDLVSVVLNAEGISKTNPGLIKKERLTMLAAALGENYAELYSDREKLLNDHRFLSKSALIRFLLKHKGNRIINRILKLF